MKNSKIKKIKAREILDSRGNPTVEVDLETDLGIFQDSVPSGVSKGKYEAVELRDGGKRYQGMGVLKAVKNVNNIICPKLKGKEVTCQKEIDNLMLKLDGTKNKCKLGANAILAVSMAVARAGAVAKNIPLYQYIAQLAENRSPLILPAPSVLLIEGGAHAGNELDFQEFMIVPQVKPFSKALQIATEIYHQLKEVIKEKYIDLGINVGYEGGFAPPLRAPEEALNLILEAAKNLGYQNKIHPAPCARSNSAKQETKELGGGVKIIIDVAASQFYEKGRYKTRFGVFTTDGLLRYYSDLVEKYPIIGLEDPFAEEDWKAWQLLKSKVNGQKSKVIIIGDDLLVTNPERIKMAKEKNACNGLLLKLNQIGTVTEAIEAANLAKSYNWEIMVSQRGGETCDSFYADVCVGLGAGWIKTGAPARGERVAKYNRLLKIEEEI